MNKELEQIGKVEISMDSLRALIVDAVQAGRKSGKNENEKAQFREVEKLLYAYPDKKAKIEKYKKDIVDLVKEGYSGKSKDIVCMQNSGIRLSPEEIQEARITDIQGKIVKLENEVKIIDWALESVKWKDTERKIKADGFEIIEMKYFKHMTIDVIAEQLHCSESTVKRWKSRLINRLITFLCD